MKKWKVAAAVVLAGSMMNLTAFAAQWASNNQGWWYDNGNGTWPASAWQWIDGNGDGVAECYYFDQYGYCLMNTTAPDGYTVDAKGAWTVNGVVQTKNVGAATTAASAGSGQSSTVSNSSAATETSISELTPVTKRAFRTFDAEETASGSIWNNGYMLVDYGYVQYKLDKKYSELSMKAILGSANAIYIVQDDHPEYTLSFIGDDDKILASYNLTKDIENAKKIRVDVSNQEYVTIRWSSERRANCNALMKEIVLK